jgi:hypothetical protein
MRGNELKALVPPFLAFISIGAIALLILGGIMLFVLSHLS